MATILTKIKEILNKIKKLFIFTFSLENEKSRLFTIFLGIIVLLLLPNYLSFLPIYSLYDLFGLYNLLGFEFYSSGMTRSLISILQLNFKQAFNYNPLGILFIFILSIIIIKDIISLIKKQK